jgi:hypothetical protein
MTVVGGVILGAIALAYLSGDDELVSKVWIVAVGIGLLSIVIPGLI